jgi:hypothetical protein
MIVTCCYQAISLKFRVLSIRFASVQSATSVLEPMPLLSILIAVADHRCS